MAKIVSFGKDAPCLTSQPAPKYQTFSVWLRVVHFDMGKNRDIQRIQVFADGAVTKRYQLDFETRNQFLRWLQPAETIGTKAANDALDRAFMSPKEKVDLPIVFEEEYLIEDGFRLVSGE